MVIIVLDKQTINKEGNMGITPQIEGTTIDFYCQFKVHLTQGNVKVISNERSHDHEKYILSLKSKDID